MKAVVYTGPYDVAVESVEDPRLEDPSDAIVRLRQVTPAWVVSHDVPLDEAPDTYEKLDKRADGSTKVVLGPGLAA